VADRKLFGTDGIRGRANEPPVTPEVALRLGRAVAHTARQNAGRPPRVVIGKDTRVSGYMLETSLAAGVCAMGGVVLLCGPIPTPGVANLTLSMRADAGIVISASHNPFDDNGIKVFGPDGFKLPDAVEARIEQLMESAEIERAGVAGAKIGRAERIEDATGRYIVQLKSTFPADLNLTGLKIVVDAANGAAYRVAPAVFAELGADVIPVACTPNGTNINKNCGALHPESVAKEVLRRKADLGIALDGDADRLILVDDRGNQVDGDVVMALHATRQIARRALPKKTVVATVMSNIGLEKALAAAGGKLKRTAVGDRYVVEEMLRHGYRFGGEQSGHLLFLDHATTGDGVLAGLQVLAIMVREQRPLSELTAVMQRFPQLLKNARYAEKRPIDRMPLLKKEIARCEKKLGQDGRVVVRWSGTEPKLRVMVEGPDQKLIERMCDEMLAAAAKDMKR
jgi:phosphoglucosamine mutase